MRINYGIGQLSASEKSDILNQHKSVYDGYRTMQPNVSNEQPLYVFDPAGDKEGLVVNNKGEVKKYTNFGINEQVESKSMCEQCGGQMTEGICEQCGPNEEEVDENWGAVARIAAPIAVNYISSKMDEETGELDDIYNQEDLNPDSGFDYIEGDSNDVDTFEKMHKNLYKEDDVIDDDGFEDKELETDELDEQGGNADDMNVDSVAPAYDFDSNGPIDVYPVNEYDDEEIVEYEKMESAWADEEIDEVDVSGSQGIYGDMEPAYDFDSEGPGKAGPYQRFSYNEEEDDDFGGDEDMETGEELYPSYSTDGEFLGMVKDDKVDWEEIDTDLQEDFKVQKNKISEMFNRMSRYN
jgi:hypothetical protein